MRVAGVTLLALFALATAAAADPPRQELLHAVEKQLKAAAEAAGPSVACVVVSRSDRYPRAEKEPDAPGKLGGFDLTAFLKAHPDQKRLALSLDLSDPISVADHGYACGVVIDPAGLILTPYHVVEGATKIYVHLPGRVGSYADVHAADARADLAVLKLLTPPAKLTPIKFGEVRLHERGGRPATVYQGKFTVLIASGYVPGFQLDRPSVALGSVTAVQFPRSGSNSDRSTSYYHYGPLIEHDAKLNVGVDGAALLNLDGEMIGLATSAAHLVSTERGPFRAFPADDNFRRVVEVLRRGEEVEYGFLGVSIPTHENTTRLSEVTAGGPADLAGLQPGDLITYIDGVPIRSYEDLLAQVGPAGAGRRATVTVSRGGRGREATVVLGKFRNAQPFIASVRPEPVFGLRVDYGSILAQLGNGRRGGGVPAGVSVREITPDSPAAAAFQRLGGNPEAWLVTQVNGNEVTTPAEFYKAAKGQKTVKLTLRDSTDPSARDREVTLP